MPLRSNRAEEYPWRREHESGRCASGSPRSATARLSPRSSLNKGREAESTKVMRGGLRWLFMVAGLALGTGVTSCAVTQQASVSGENYCPFLGASLCAKLTPGTSGQIDLRYVNPNVQWTQYKKVLIEPVTFWAGENTTISAADQRILTNFLYQALEAQLGQKFQVVDKPGPGVMVVQTALLDATTATPGLRSISVVEPHVRAIATLKYLATGTYPFVGSASAEGKVTDSLTGQVLAAGVSKRVGGGSVKAADQWELGDAENALTYWAQLMATQLSSWASGTTAS